jgi:predicted acylesterase/phospholipase RssA
MPAFQISKHPRLFRTYPAPKHEGDNCPIWQAARATSAAPTFFKRIKIGREEFIDGGMGCNNPTGEVLEEAKLIFPTRSIACILSIGTGKPNVNRLQGPTSFQRVVPTNVINALKGIAIDCEGVAVDIGKRFGETPDVYFRFNVEQGMQNVMLGQWDKLGEVETYTRGYLQDPDVDRKIDAAVNALIERRPIVPTKQIGL